LRPWLIGVLRSEKGSSVERSGAAQGLTELLCAGGTGLVNEVMKDEILPLIDHPKANTREGVLWVLTFLPSSLGQSFASLIDASFPALISGLSDDNESVRDVAMRAGRVTIRSHGKAHVDKILPSLEDGLSNEDYRIRAASLNLLGDLLSTLAGSKVSKGDIDTQEDIRQAERAQAQIALVLGPDTRKRVLSALYLRRSDTAAVVRQAAVRVWKSVVSVTPRTLREILDSLVEQIVNALASGHPDHTQVAGRCLGDIVSKLGDMVLPEIMPILKDALYKGDTHTRLGACVGLTEVIGCSTKEQITKYLDILVRVVEEALCDDDEGVRKMAASCFQNLYSVVSNRAFDEIVPQLLASMESGDDRSRARAINGITGILSIRSKELLPYLVSRLVKSRPISRNQASALGSICTVTGGSIHAFFGTIVPALLSELSDIFNVELDEEENAREEALRKCIQSLCSSVEEIGVNALIGEVASKCGSDKEGTRKEACWMMQTIVEESKSCPCFYAFFNNALYSHTHVWQEKRMLIITGKSQSFCASFYIVSMTRARRYWLLQMPP
jgi:HEAT repeat protein